MSTLTEIERSYILEMVEKLRPRIEAQAEIVSLRDEVDLWKDRCMAAEQALDAAIKSHEEELAWFRGNW